eukprot:jgi/Chlat1/316/Chrsp1S03066
MAWVVRGGSLRRLVQQQRWMLARAAAVAPADGAASVALQQSRLVHFTPALAAQTRPGRYDEATERTPKAIFNQADDVPNYNKEDPNEQQSSDQSGQPDAFDERGSLRTTTMRSILKQQEGAEKGKWLWVSEDDDVMKAVHMMVKENVGAVVVMKASSTAPASGGGAGKEAKADAGQERTVAGILKERDVLSKVVTAGKDMSSTHARDIMTPKHEMVSVTPDTTALSALDTMAKHRIKHIPVIDGETLNGMVSMGDLIERVVQELSRDTDELRQYVSRSEYM